jgi:molybdopterin converting factor small subunit
MKVVVRYLSQVKQAAGRSSEEVELDMPCSVRQLIPRLADRHGTSLRNVLLTVDGRIQPALLLFVGDTQLAANDDVPLTDGDEVLVMTPIAGG